MTEREFAEFQYKLGYYEELLIKRLGEKDKQKLLKLETKLDEWYFQAQAMNKKHGCKNQALVM